MHKVERQGRSLASWSTVKAAPVSSAQIDITFVGTTATREVFSDASGNFTVPSLPVGAYDVVVRAAGFSTSKYSGVTVRLTETTRLNPSLGASSAAKTDATTGTAQVGRRNNGRYSACGRGRNQQPGNRPQRARQT